MEESQQGILIWCSYNEWKDVLAAVLIQRTLQGKPQGRWQDKTRKCGSWTPANPKREGECLRGPRWSIVIRAMHLQCKRQHRSMGTILAVRETSQKNGCTSRRDRWGEGTKWSGLKHHSTKRDERPCNRWYTVVHEVFMALHSHSSVFSSLIQLNSIKHWKTSYTHCG